MQERKKEKERKKDISLKHQSHLKRDRIPCGEQREMECHVLFGQAEELRDMGSRQLIRILAFISSPLLFFTFDFFFVLVFMPSIRVSLVDYSAVIGF